MAARGARSVLAGIAFAIATCGAFGQTQSQIQYTYDAAGNLIGVTRSPVGPTPDLTVTNLTVGMVTVNPSGSFNIPVSFQVNNVGTVAANATWYDRVYLSATAVLHDSDQVLPPFNTRSANLAAGANYTFTTTLTTTTATSAGNYFIVVKADSGTAASGQFAPTGPNVVAEVNETNNVQSAPVVLAGVPKPDLRLTNQVLGTIVSNQDGTYNVPVSYTVTNIGTAGIAATTFLDRGYLSSDAVLHDNDLVIPQLGSHATLAAGANYAANLTFILPASVAPGAYYLVVKTDGGAAASGQFSPTGTNNIAEYDETNNQQIVPIALARPDLTVSNTTVGTKVANQDGSIAIPITWTVTNTGGLAAQPTWYDLAYLSSNATLDNADVNLAGYFTRSTALAAAANYTQTTTYTVPATTVSGSYTLFMKADGRGTAINQGTNTDNGRVVEANDANNTQAVPLTLPARPDLVVSGTTIGTLIANQDGSIAVPITRTVTNTGGLAAQPFWYDLAYLSSNATLDNADVNLAGYFTRSTALASGAGYTQTTTYTVPAATGSGPYTLFMKADGRGTAINQGTNTDKGRVVEANDANNAQAVPLTLPARPDLVVSGTTIGTLIANQDGSIAIPITWTVTNTGGLAAQPFWYDLAYLSSNATLDNADVNLAGYFTRSTALASGAGYTQTTTYTVPAATGSGPYTLFMKADGRGAAVGQGTNSDSGRMVEANEANNAQGVTLTIPARPDLTVSNASVGTLVANQDGSITISGTVTVTNSGGLAAQPSWWDLAYLSTDGVLDNADVNLAGYRTNTAALAPGASYSVPFTYIAPATVASGTYTFFLKADGRGAAVGQGTNSDSGRMVEASEANNAQGIALTIPPRPDLVVSNVTVGTIVKNANNSTSIPVTYTITNTGGLAAQPTWYDLAYLSTDGVLDNADLNLSGYRTSSAALAPGGTYTATITYITPTSTAAGSYTLFMKTDGRGAAISQGTNTDNGKAVESNELNNVMAIPVVLP